MEIIFLSSCWLYQDKEFTEAPKEYYGFVYRITNLLTGKMYIGRKYFWSMRKPRGKKRRQKSESNWKDYYGSSDVLKDDIEKYGVKNFKREIISLHKTKGQVNYTEIKVQFQEDVLYALDDNQQRLYYNGNILSRYFAPKDVE